MIWLTVIYRDVSIVSFSKVNGGAKAEDSCSNNDDGLGPITVLLGIGESGAIASVDDGHFVVTLARSNFVYL